MPKHKSCKKKEDVNKKRHLRNSIRIKYCRYLLREFRKSKTLEDTSEYISKIKKSLDIIKNKRIWHRNKVNRLKASCDRRCNILHGSSA
jgi:ribosomal protein S20